MSPGGAERRKQISEYATRCFCFILCPLTLESQSVVDLEMTRMSPTKQNGTNYYHHVFLSPPHPEGWFFWRFAMKMVPKKVFIPSSRLTDGEKNHPCLFCSFRLGLEHNIVYSSHNILDNVKIYVRPAGGIFVVNLAFYLLVEKLIFNIGTILQTCPDVTLWVHYYILPIRNIHQGYYGCGPPPS